MLAIKSILELIHNLVIFGEHRTFDLGSGAVGRAVASNARDLRFESFHRINLTELKLNWKTKIKKIEKRPWMANFLKALCLALCESLSVSRQLDHDPMSPIFLE